MTGREPALRLTAQQGPTASQKPLGLEHRLLQLHRNAFTFSAGPNCLTSTHPMEWPDLSAYAVMGPLPIPG